MTPADLTPVRWRRVRELFDELVTLPPERRQERLAVLRASEEPISRAVETLLEADAASGERLAPLESLLATTPEVPGADARRRTSNGDVLGLVGRQVAQFRVVAPIASGGMGVVYRARDERLGRDVALKLPLPHLHADAESRARFLREARAVGTLDHPNICGIHQVGEADDGLLFLAMTLYEGETLRDRLARVGALPVDEALRIAQAIAAGLEAAHAAGIIHRDIKPSNVMLLRDGGVKVMDFGVASMHDGERTVTGRMAGTLAYVAPELIRGERADARSDLWSLGVVLYEMLAGHAPFEGPHEAATMYRIVHQPEAEIVGAPPAPMAVVRQLLAKSRDDRPASAAVVATLLATAAAAPMRGDGRSWTARLGGRAVVGAACVVAGLWAIARMMAPSSPPVSPQRREAMRHVEEGRALMKGPPTVQTFTNAQQAFALAVSADSTYGEARALLAMAEIFGFDVAKDTRPAARVQARLDAEAALRVAPDLALAWRVMGMSYQLEQKPDSAALMFRGATDRDPNDADAHFSLGLALQSDGRMAEAVPAFERTVALEPSHSWRLQALATAYGRLRRYREAIATWDRVSAVDSAFRLAPLLKGFAMLRLEGTADSLDAAARRMPPERDLNGIAAWARFVAARIRRQPEAALAEAEAMRPTGVRDLMFMRPRVLLLAQAHEMLGDAVRARPAYAAALAEAREQLTKSPDDFRVHVVLGLAAAGLGDRATAVAAAARAMALSGPRVPRGEVTSAMADAAEILVRAGDHAGAIALLRQLLAWPAGRELSVPLLRVDPVWDPLRNDPAFGALLVPDAP